MTTKAKQLPHEKRKGEAALSDFAEYVEKQQELRFPSSRAASSAAVSTPATAPQTQTQTQPQPDIEHHSELDDLLDNLGLSDDPHPRAKLRDLLLSTDDASLDKLADVVAERLAEGFGETVFEIGFEDSGDSMKLPVDEFHAAYKRLVEAARKAGADCQLLLTKNVGGELDAAATARDRDASGKVMVRRVPRTVEDVIETRIAVVGNGESCILLVSDGAGDIRPDWGNQVGHLSSPVHLVGRHLISVILVTSYTWGAC